MNLYDDLQARLNDLFLEILILLGFEGRSGACHDLSRLNETRWTTGLSTQLKHKDRPLCAHNDGRLKRLSSIA